MLLQDKVAIVTGGSRGIGHAIVSRFEAEGALVIYTARSRPAVEATASLTGRISGVVCDGRDEAAVAATVAEVLTRYGRIDVLVNNAGIARDAMIHRMSLEMFRDVVDANLQGSWLWTREAVRHMRAREGGGSIVNISSIAGKAGNLGQGAYAASKAAVVALTKTTAREGARFGIRANAIRPGVIDTEMVRSISAEARRRLMEDVPLGRAGSPEEVASVAAFLASDMAAYMTGTVLDVSGGRYM